jgi:hypothetical protein
MHAGTKSLHGFRKIFWNAEGRGTADPIQQYCRVHGHQLAGPCREFYGHWKDDWSQHPERSRTDVFYLLTWPG